MILFFHKNNKITNIVDHTSRKELLVSENNILLMLFEVAKANTNELLVWCHEDIKENLNIEGLKESFYLKNMMMSYSSHQYLPTQIGYVEDSPFLKVNKRVKYPTWLMSSNVGAIHASQLIKFKGQVSANNSFEFALNSIAKLGMPKGLFCYSEPKLLVNPTQEYYFVNTSNFKLFKFVKKHYRSRWIFLLFINFIWHEKKIPLISVIKSIFYKRLVLNADFYIEKLNGKLKKVITSIDVIIPTMGRKQYLFDVLQDLSKQTLLPENVIIVEQSDDNEKGSELDYLEDKVWPFKIKHEFTHQIGACNARNLALKKVTSNGVFLADDDIRLKPNILEDSVVSMDAVGLKAATLSCLNKGEKETISQIIQWHSFGSGCSIVSHEILKKIKFDMAYEHGFSEDEDFGMQIRNLGEDIGYLPNCGIIHLKAPTGGFRVKFKEIWKDDEIQPKPSPTVMLFKLKHQSKHQLLGYKTKLFIKYFRLQKNKNIITYVSQMNRRWIISEYWANKLSKNNQ